MISSDKRETLIQFIKFGVVGFSNTLISYFTYLFCLWLFNKFSIFEKYDYLIAQLIGFVISVCWSFFWNNKYVFSDGNESRNIVKSFVKTFISYASTGLVLSSVLSFVWVELLYISKVLAPIINLCITVPLNFVLNKKWAFK